MVFGFRAVRGLSQAFHRQGRPACAASSTQESTGIMPVVSYQWPWWSQCWPRAGKLGLPHFLLGFPMPNTHVSMYSMSTQELTPVTQFAVGALWFSTVEIQNMQAHTDQDQQQSLLSILSPCLFLWPQAAAKHYWTAGLPSCETWPEVALITAVKILEEKLLTYQLIQAMTKHLFSSSEKEEWRMTTCIQQWHFAFWKFTTRFPNISYHYIDLQDSILWITGGKETH